MQSLIQEVKKKNIHTTKISEMCPNSMHKNKKCYFYLICRINSHMKFVTKVQNQTTEGT